MSRRGGATPFAAIAFAALLCITVLCVECGAASERDSSRSGAVSFIKASIRWIRHFIQTYHPEIDFATCAISSFPYLDPYPEPFLEFRQLPLGEPLPDSSTYSIPSSTSPSTPSSLPSISSHSITSIPSPPTTSTSSLSTTPHPSSTLSPISPLPSPSTLSPSTSSPPSSTPSLSTPPPSSSILSPLSLSSSSCTPSPSTSSPLSSTFSLSAPYPPSPSSPSPLSSSYSPSNSSYLSPPSSSSFPPSSTSSFSITHSPPFPLSPFSELPSLILLESLAASGIPQDDSLFVLDLLGILFPTVFNRPVKERRNNVEGDVSRDGSKGNEKVLDTWLSAIRAVVLSVSGISPFEYRQSWWDWIAVPVYKWNLAVPPQNRRWALVPLPGNSALRAVKEEEDEGGLLLKMWRSWRKAAVRWFNRLRWWMNPGADHERMDGPKSTVIGLAQCMRTYLVDVVWRWAETGHERLESKSFRLPPPFRPSALPSKARVGGVVR